MLKGIIKILGRNNQGTIFSDDCLKAVVKDAQGKVYPIGKGIGIIKNIRYKKGEVIGDFEFPHLFISAEGKVAGHLDLPGDKRSVTTFLLEKFELLEDKAKNKKKRRRK